MNLIEYTKNFAMNSRQLAIRRDIQSKYPNWSSKLKLSHGLVRDSKPITSPRIVALRPPLPQPRKPLDSPILNNTKVGLDKLSKSNYGSGTPIMMRRDLVPKKFNTPSLPRR